MQAFIIEASNRPGSLADVCEAVAAAGANIAGVTGSTAGGAGQVALTTDDVDGTRAVIQAHAWPFREVPLVIAALEHRPGTLAAAARRLAGAGINIDAMFVTGMDGDKVQVAFGVSDAAAARAALGEMAS
jgi:hypothetical protein